MGTTLDSIGIVLSFILILFLSLLFYKYIIDTKITINELKKDREVYRRFAWEGIIKSGNKNIDLPDPPSNNFVYDNLKNKINLLYSDIQDTDFSSFGNIKEEILNALRDIDSYGESK